MRKTRLLSLVALCVATTEAADQPPAAATAPAERAPGVLVYLYDIEQSLSGLPDLPLGIKPNVVEVRPTLALDTFGIFNDYFVTEVVGFLSIERAGPYEFRLLSDDGARLWVNHRVIIDHDGLHGLEPKDGTVQLEPGVHALRILHFEMSGGEHLELQWRVPESGAAEFVAVPAAALSHDPQAARETAPGKKRVIPPLRRGRPGDGAPVAGLHPDFELFPEPAPPLPVPGPRPDSVGILGVPFAPRTMPILVWLPATGGPGELGGMRSMPDGGMPTYIAVDDAIFRMHSDLYAPFTGQGYAFRFSAGQKIDPFRLNRKTEEVFEISSIDNIANGFLIEFTKPLHVQCGWDPDGYYIERWPYDYRTGQPPRRDGVRVPVESASVSPDRRRVLLEIENLQPEAVMYIRMLPPLLSENNDLLWSTEAWYTLNEIIPNRPARPALPRPPQPAQNVLTEQEREAGWRLLFDGRSPAGWCGYGQKAFPTGWQVRDGCLVRVGPGGDIMTEEEFDDFELSLEWRISAAGNSGIFYRVDSQYKYPWETGPEMQVLDNSEHADGRNPRTSAGSNYALHAPVVDATEPVGFFNVAKIVVRGPHVEHWLNGRKLLEYELGSPEWERLVAESKFAKMLNYGRTKKGHIVLQDHGDQVWYRNIKLRPLTTQ